MVSYEYKSSKLSVIFSDSSPQNTMFYNRLVNLNPSITHIPKVKIPDFFNNYVGKSTILIRMVNEILTGKAYVELCQHYRNGTKYGYWMYFEYEEDAIAFKLKWS